MAERNNETSWTYIDTSQNDKALKFVDENTQEVDVNNKLNTFSTTLMREAFNGSLEMVEHLLRSGADVMKIDSAGNTALHWAMKGRHYTIAEQIIHKESHNQEIVSQLINTKNDSGDTIIMMMFLNQDSQDLIDLLNLLKKCGGDFNVKNSTGIPLLHLTVAGETSDIMFQWLINNLKEQNAEVVNSTIDSKDPCFPFANMPKDTTLVDGFTPLHFAILSKKLDKMKVLIKNRADVETYRPICIWKKYVKDYKSKASDVTEFLLDVELERIFDVLGQAVESILEIQRFYEEKKKVYVDVSKGKKEHVGQELMKMCPDLHTYINISLIEQSSEPEYIVKPWLGVSSVDANLLESVCVPGKCFKNFPGIGYGTIAGFIKGKDSHEYAVTAHHVVAKQLSEMSSHNKHIFTEDDSGLLKISSQYFGVFGEFERNGVDAAILPLLKKIQKPLPDQTNNITIFCGDRKDLLHRHVRMKGATTPLNTGVVDIANYRRKIGEKCAITVLVKPTGKALHFAEKGDSGGLVSLDDSGDAVGMVIMKHTDYMHNDIKLQQSATVVLLCDCLKAISQTHNIDLDMGYIMGLDS